MSVQPIVLRPDQHEPALNVVGTQVTVLASNAATQSYGITLQQGEEGTGPPPHSHDWDEAFYVLKGEIHFLCDDGTGLQAGALVELIECKRNGRVMSGRLSGDPGQPTFEQPKLVIDSWLFVK